MSAILTDRPPAVSRRFDAEPRVQLLPPFVAQRAKARSAMRMGIMFVIAGLIVATGMFMVGIVRSTFAQLDLVNASATTQALLQQQAEFRIATDTAAMVEQTTETQLVATSYEIDWARLLVSMQGFLPTNATIESITATSQAPWVAGLEIEDPLRTPRIATIELVVNTASIPEAVALSERLRDLTGFADAVVTASAVGVDGRATTTISLTLSTDAVSGRFAAQEADGAAGSEAGNGSGESENASDTGTTVEGSED